MWKKMGGQNDKKQWKINHANKNKWKINHANKNKGDRVNTEHIKLKCMLSTRIEP